MRDDHKHMYALCKQYMHSFVHAELSDGYSVDGIITGLDDEYVYLAVPNVGYGLEAEDNSYTYDQRQYGYPGYGFAPAAYGYPRPRPFRRVLIPLIALTALTLLPWY